MQFFKCRFPCRADNAAYPHDGPADKRRYRHDRRADSQCLPRHCYTMYYPKPLIPRCNSDTGCLKWRKTRTHLSFPECVGETTTFGRPKATARPHTFCQVLDNHHCNISTEIFRPKRDLQNRYVAKKFLNGTSWPFRR